MPVKDLKEYQRNWVDGLNRGDLSAADKSFAPDCVFHITGQPTPLRGIGQWKGLIQGFFTSSTGS